MERSGKSILLKPDVPLCLFPPFERWNGFCHQIPRLVFRHNFSLIHDSDTFVYHFLPGNVRLCECTFLETIGAVLFRFGPVCICPKHLRSFHRHCTALTKWSLRLDHDPSSFLFLKIEANHVLPIQEIRRFFGKLYSIFFCQTFKRSGGPKGLSAAANS